MKEPLPVSNAQPILLKTILDELSLATSDETVYLHKPTGRLQTIPEEEITILSEVHDDMLPEIEVEIIDEIREVLTSDDWVPLPSPGVRDEAVLLQGFCETLEGGEVRSQFTAILQHHHRVSQRVLDFLDDNDLEEQWREFQRQAMHQTLALCLQRHAIEYQ